MPKAHDHYYSTDLTLGEYIERAQMDADRVRNKVAEEKWRAQEDARSHRDQRLAALLAEDRPAVQKTPAAQKTQGDQLTQTENIMNTTLRECKIETTDKVEFIEGCAPKFDHGKVRLDLLPVRSMKDIAEVLTIGADKYGANSWREGEMIAWSRCYSAAQRHLMQFWSGEDLDPETGKSHLAHAACNLLFMIEHSYINKIGDDRPTTGAPFKDNQ